MLQILTRLRQLYWQQPCPILSPETLPDHRENWGVWQIRYKNASGQSEAEPLVFSPIKPGDWFFLILSRILVMVLLASLPHCAYKPPKSALRHLIGASDLRELFS